MQYKDNILAFNKIKNLINEIEKHILIIDGLGYVDTKFISVASIRERGQDVEEKLEDVKNTLAQFCSEIKDIYEI